MGIKIYFKTKIFLKNTNYENVDSLMVTTNEFGSFSGKFQLPTNSMNGEFSIHDEDDHGRAGFSVEEYKRPKFFVEYEKLKGTYKVNDLIKITGISTVWSLILFCIIFCVGFGMLTFRYYD